MPDLTSADFDLAFTFRRRDAASYRGPDGQAAIAAVDEVRFDHDLAGVPLGLAVDATEDLGGGDRVTIDPLILPDYLFDFAVTGATDCTVLHIFDDGTGLRHHAWYSRNAQATIDGLLAAAGHHRAIGVVPGFRPDEGGFVFYRGFRWDMPPLVMTGGEAITNNAGLPIISAGAELV